MRGKNPEREELWEKIDRLTAERDALKAEAAEWHGVAGAYAKQRDSAKTEAEALRKAVQAAFDCGMVPISSARDGGACAYSVHAQVADMLRDAIAAQQGERHE